MGRGNPSGVFLLCGVSDPMLLLLCVLLPLIVAAFFVWWLSIYCTSETARQRDESVVLGVGLFLITIFLYGIALNMSFLRWGLGFFLIRKD